MRDALIASGTELVTVALRRADLSGNTIRLRTFSILSIQNVFSLLPNTSGARNAHRGRAPRAAGCSRSLPKWISRDTSDPRYLLTRSGRDLGRRGNSVKEGFTVLPISMRSGAGEAIAGRVDSHGMPLGSPIGSNRGIETRPQIAHHRTSTVPVVVDAGLGAPSQAAEAMERGATGARQHSIAIGFRSRSHGKSILKKPLKLGAKPRNRWRKN